MNGLILINKPLGYSSYDVIRVLKKLFKFNKIGHTGTLDPQATGLLILCLGKATKLIPLLEIMNKIYEVIMILGYSTDTDDLEGKVINRSFNVFKEEEIIKAIKSFEGNISQIPPKYSAVKIDGKRAYELALKSLEFEIKPKNINIEYIKIEKVKNNYVHFITKVSKGTYVRSLVRDIGLKLGSYATTAYINRLAISNFSLDNAYNLKQIKELYEKNDLSFLMNIENIFNFNRIDLNLEDYIKLELGTFINLNLEEGYYKIYCNNEFKGFGIFENRGLKRHLII